MLHCFHLVLLQNPSAVCVCVCVCVCEYPAVLSSVCLEHIVLWSLAVRIPGTGEPGGLPSMGLHSRTRLKQLSSSRSSSSPIPVLVTITLLQTIAHFSLILGKIPQFPLYHCQLVCLPASLRIVSVVFLMQTLYWQCCSDCLVLPAPQSQFLRSFKHGHCTQATTLWLPPCFYLPGLACLCTGRLTPAAC